MSETSVPSQQPENENKMRTVLIFGAIGLLAALVFGLLYLFVLAPTVPNGSLGWYLFSFATGLTMIVMPCTLPLAFVIVPLSMGKGVVRGLGMALAFGIGVASTLSLYGIAAALLGGAALDFLGADIEALKNWVYFFAGSFAFLFALSEIGLMNVHMPTYSGAAPAFIQKRGEIIKAFMLGLFLGNVGVGCPHPATPLILIEIATSGDILYGWTMFLTHAVGRVIPLLLLAFLAVLGVNGLNWLMARKPTVERVTGWAMVFVAGFILTLGLFTHDWWVNSGLHNALEAATQESFFNSWFNAALGQNVAHVHGIEEGEGLFGQPLEWGHWFLVLVWLIPIWWWWLRKKKKLETSPSFALERLQHELDTVEEEIRAIEATAKIDELDGQPDIAALEAQMDQLKKARRAAAKKVNYGETGILKDEVARNYESKILGMHRNYLIAISIFLALTFIYFLPTNFYLKSTGGGHDDHGDHGSSATMLEMSGTAFSTSVAGLPDTKGVELVTLRDGESYDITAAYVKKEVGNRTLRMLAYNGSVPGPIINAEQGSEITINFTNNTDIDQTIHSHGVRIDNLSDGVPGQTQEVVKPGDSYSYTIKFEDAGVYWYHPHTRDDYGQEMGLYGNYLIEPSDPDYWSPVNREVPLVIDDVLINNNQIENFYKEYTNFALLGRFGNEYLVNGEVDYTTVVRAGEVIRFFVTNVANARTFNLSIPGAKLKLVGADLSKFERETYVDSVLISPAERVVVEAYFEESGVYKLMHTTPDGETEIARFVADSETPSVSYVDSFNVLRSNADVIAELKDVRQYQNATPDKELKLTIDLMGGMVDHSAHAHGTVADDHSTMDHSDHAHSDTTTSGSPDSRLVSIQWDDATQSDRVNTTDTILWKLIDTETGDVNMDIHWTFKLGDLVKVRLVNDNTADHVMQHPIHFHGQRFVVLTENGVPNQNMAWKDTALVYPGETMDILVDMSNSGEWMAHCHISEHLHAGMMLGFRVEDASGYAQGDEFRASLPQTNTSGHMHSDGEMHDHSTEAIAQNQKVVMSQMYSFSDTGKADTAYAVNVTSKFAKAAKMESVQLSFKDTVGNPVNLSDTAERALAIQFVRSDDAISFVTYPGNTEFPEPAHGAPGHDNSDGHHGLRLINTAFAHGDAVDDGHHEGSVVRTYTVPVQFPEEGVYRGFVEFVLEGESEPRIGYFDIEVSSGSLSVDNFGWSPMVKWWILLIGSLLLMVPLVLGVRRYINVDKA